MSYPSSPAGPDDRGSEPHGYPVPLGDLPPRPPVPGARIGRASGVELRQELLPGGDSTAYSATVLAFRLLEPGNPQPLDVELRGRSLNGTVREGDWIEVAGPPDALGRWSKAKLVNLTTGATVVMMGGRSKVGTVVGLVVLSVVALIVLLIGAAVVAALASS